MADDHRVDLPRSLTPSSLIRKADATDVPALVGLLADDPIAQFREVTTDLGPYRRAFAAIDADPAHLLVVAESDGLLVGTLQLTVLPSLARQGALRAQLEAVRVHRNHRSSGLGSALVRWAIEEAHDQGCALVQLTSDARRTAAHTFYERLGFVPSHVGYKLDLQA